WSSLADYWRYLMGAAGRLLPVGAGLHQGRYVLEGWQRHHRNRCLDTLLTVETLKTELAVPDASGWPSAEPLAGQRLTDLNAELARQAVRQQAPEGHLEVTLPRLDAFHLGALLAFFQRAAGLTELALEATAGVDERQLRLSSGAAGAAR
ncbi:MAG: hypothetical protein AB1758_25440, partial [Candidatus Eremiobacterota bacterium]